VEITWANLGFSGIFFIGNSGYLKNLSGNTGIGLQAVGLKCTLAAFTAGDAPG